ncbi:MAG TPA: GGDEF domain-containing protein [Gammaproteobacteria bacterium]|nr:GGDEF domain-containing protein [Gammaproteobacteria bacterium]
MSWKFFPEDAKQSLRIRRFLMAALSYVLWVGLTAYCYQLGLVQVSPQGFWIAVALTGVCNLVFYALLRSGLNRYWPDPSLTLPQMVVATVWVMLLMALAPKVRGMLLMLYAVVFLFGVFRLRRGEYLGLTALVTVGYGLVVLRDVYRQDSGIPLPLEALQFVVLAATLLWLAFFGSYVGKLREAVSRRNTELAAALAKNRRLAVHDDLTGTYNRRHIMQILEQEQLRAQRTGRGFTLCLMDLDHFKTVNDRYGHLGGDDVLRQFAMLVLREIRTLDRVGRDGPGAGQWGDENFGRFGGEEFMLVMPETDLNGAYVCMERIRRKVAETPLQVEGSSLTLTVSCGLAAYRPGEDLRATLSRADQALYQAKEAGRDRVKSVMA